MASGEDFVFHLLEIHFTVNGFLHSSFMSIGHLVSQSICSPLASFVPRLQSNQSAFWYWNYLLKTIHVQGPFRRVDQLNPTDFATSLTLLHSFSKSRKFLFGVWWRSSFTQQLSIAFSPFFTSGDQWAHLTFGYVGGPSVFS